MSFGEVRGKSRAIPIVLILGIVLMIGVVAAAYMISGTQPVTVTTPFTVTVSSSAGATCSGSTTITCTGVSLPVGATELLNATIVYGSQQSVTYSSLSSNPAVATVSPSGPTTITVNRQSFTVTGVSAGTATITLSFT